MADDHGAAAEEGLLQKDYAEALKLVGDAEEKASDLEGQDRSFIAKLVIWLYMGAVLICLVFIVVVLWFMTPCSDTVTTACVAWKEPADFLLQVLTTAVLPIVTLVLGYYFGTAKSEGG